ncbi:MAG: acylneuraminate cytidylyltransferase family protein [Syntrophomonadaceae bacterium]|nr:acylneuraminate cytidylyltransferase family protein [Syntrophomonadaceae bacterium]
MKTIAIIPARGGSKGIPGKNIMDFCGKPLIAWSILQAKHTPEIDEVYLTSDSNEILDIAKEFGASTIVRPADIAGDTASSESAIEHALSVIGNDVELVIMLQATSPLRKPDDLSKAIRQFREEKWDSAFSGAMLDDFLIWDLDQEGQLKSFNYDYLNRGRRQDRKSQYVENGSFYLFKPEILAQGNRMGGKIGVYLMEFWQTFEIDNRDDIKLMEILFQTFKDLII